MPDDSAYDVYRFLISLILSILTIAGIMALQSYSEALIMLIIGAISIYLTWK